MFNWYALYTKSRHEFIANNELMKKGIITFLPSVKKLRQWKDRKKWVDFPLFPGYLFVYIRPNPEEFVNVLRTIGVVRFLSFEPGNPAPVPPEEINSLKILLKSGKEFDIYPHLKEGTRVRLVRGPLMGAEGVIRKKEDHYMLIINIEILGRSVGVKVYAGDIERV